MKKRAFFKRKEFFSMKILQNKQKNFFPDLIFLEK